MEDKKIVFSISGVMLLLSISVLIPSATATGLSMQYGALNLNSEYYSPDEQEMESNVYATIYNYYDWWGWDAPPVNCYW